MSIKPNVIFSRFIVYFAETDIIRVAKFSIMYNVCVDINAANINSFRLSYK